MTRIYPPSVVAKFGGTSVAYFDAMNRSASIVLADQDVRLVVLSASAGVTNLLVELSEGLETHQQLDKLETLRAIQYNIISRLKQPSVISTEIDNLLNNIRHLAQTATVSPSDALSDELVSHGELMSSLLFTEVLRERHAEAGWFDVRSVMRTNSSFGCAEPELSTLHHLVETHLRPRLEQAIMVTRGLSAGMPQGIPLRWDAVVVITRRRFSVRRFTPHAWTSGPMSQGSTPPIRALRRGPNGLTTSHFPRPAIWPPSVRRSSTRLRCFRQCVKAFRFLLAQVRIRLPVVRWCITPPTTHLAIVRLPCAVNRRCCDYIVWRHNRPVLPGAVLRHFSSPRGHGGFGYNLREQYCAGAGRDSRYLR